MKVSIIITAYNRPILLREAVESAVRQSYRDTEVIVVDASTSPLMQPRSDVKYHWIEDKGISQARNFGAQKASGDAFVFLDDDNYLSPSYAAKTAALLAPGVGFISTSMRVISAVEETYVPGKVMPLNKLMYENQVHSSSLVARGAFEQAGGFKEDVYEDWELWINILKLGYRMETVKELLFHYRSHEPSLITRHKERHDERIANMRRIHADIYAETK